MAGESCDVLIHVEDPGAANLVVGLGNALGALGLRLRLLAPGGLAPFLAAHEVPHETAPADLAGALDGTRPRAVVVGTSENPDSPAFSLLAAARARGIPTAGLVDGPANAHLRFRGRSRRPLDHAPDRLAVPDDGTAALYEELGFDRGRIAVCGHPLYDRVRAARSDLERIGRPAIRAKAFPGAAAGKRLILFLAELSDGLDPPEFRRSADYTLSGRRDSDRRTDIVLEEVLDALRPARSAIHFVLRLHPKNTEAEFAGFRGEIDDVSIGGSPWQPAFAADLVIGMTTSLLFEAALLGRPTLSVVPRKAEQSWLPAIATGVTRCALSRADLVQLLPGAAFAPDLLGGVPAESVVRFGAAERLARFVADLASGDG